MMNCFVIIAEKATGKVLHQDGSRYQEGDPDYKLPFDSLVDAVNFSESYRESHQDFECIVVDEAGKCLQLFR
jgi:hypothetical protein